MSVRAKRKMSDCEPVFPGGVFQLIHVPEHELAHLWESLNSQLPSTHINKTKSSTPDRKSSYPDTDSSGHGSFCHSTHSSRLSSRSSSGVFSVTDSPPPPVTRSRMNVAVRGRIQADSPRYLVGQSPDQACVKMSPTGTLTFAPLGQKGEGFIDKLQGFTVAKRGSYFSLESEDYSGRYLAADTVSGTYTVKGMIKEEMPKWPDSTYWRLRLYSRVASNPHAPSSWICLQYWGDERFRPDPVSYDGYYMVAEGKGASTQFKLGDRSTAVKTGIFAFLPQ